MGTFLTTVSDDGVHTNKGILGGGICPDPVALAGLFGKVSVAKTGDGGSMTLDISGGFFNVPEPFKCHVTAKRSSAADPGVSQCP
jgi:hypothetical protein